MKIAIVINGTRGDVQPMLALAEGLQKNGHEIILCAPPENEELVKRYNCPFVPFGPNYKEIFKQNANMKGGATTSPSPKKMKEETENQITKLPSILKGSDLLLGVGFVLGLQTVADILKIPYRFVIFYPALLGPSKTDNLKYRIMFSFGRSMTNMVMKKFINKYRLEFGLQPIPDVWKNWMSDKVIVACDKELNEAKKGVAFDFIQTAYMHLPSKTNLPENVEKFITSGEPPVFISFGSNPISKPEKFAQIFIEVSKETKQRLIVSKGWADLIDDNSQDILYVDEMPFEYLFPKLSAIVFHGGTGTMAAAAKAGIPQIAFPFMADQFDNRIKIEKLGIGPKVRDFKKITEHDISNAISECLKNKKYKNNAIELSNKLKDINGVDMTVQIIENELKTNTN